jgi:hypothetical protein
LKSLVKHDRPPESRDRNFAVNPLPQVTILDVIISKNINIIVAILFLTFLLASENFTPDPQHLTFHLPGKPPCVQIDYLTGYNQNDTDHKTVSVTIVRPFRLEEMRAYDRPYI